MNIFKTGSVKRIWLQFKSRSNPSAIIQAIHEQIARVPQNSQPDSPKIFLERLEYQSFPMWASPQLILCRVEPNIQNFIQRPGA